MSSPPGSEPPPKHCLVAVDTPHGPWLCPVELPAAATIGTAVARARRLAAAAAVPQVAQVDWQGAAVGLWGVLRSRDAVPDDGDRIEVYRPLPADPRQRRRQQARAKTRAPPGR